MRGQSSYFVWLNRSKESITLDLKKPGGAEILDRLLARADVFVQNVAPGAADRLGTSPAELQARYPRLIICSVSGYGSAGPHADRRAYDLLVQSEAGLLSLTGTEDQPSKVGISVADIAAGMYAYSGILTALLTRVSHGRGAVVEVSLFDALAEWMSAPAAYTAYRRIRASANRPASRVDCSYGPVTTRDGETVYLAIQNAREWARLCADVLMHRTWPLTLALPRIRCASRTATRSTPIATVAGGLTAAELIARLDAAHIAHARMNTMADFVAHPQLSARDRWREIETPAGPVKALIPPVIFEE